MFEKFVQRMFVLIFHSLLLKSSTRLWRSPKRKSGSIPQLGPIFLGPSVFPESAQTLAAIDFYWATENQPNSGLDAIDSGREDSLTF